MTRYIRWFLWTLYYLPQRSTPPRDFAAWLKRTERTWAPWWKFKPYLYHSEEQREWHIAFANDMDYWETCTLTIEVGRSQETGRIVGMVLPDRVLEKTI